MWIKICGLTQEKDISACIQGGVSAIGLNFYPPSPRSVDVSGATDLSAFAAGTAPDIERIGVFVNSPIDEIVDIFETAGLTGIQLHGDEPAEVLRRLRERCAGARLVRAFRVNESTINDVDDWLQECRSQSVTPDNVLLDARVTGAYGGTGMTAPWQLVAGHQSRNQWPPLILAGGLTAENVAQGIRVVQPFGVDTASGVEMSPGVKSADRIGEFLRACTGIQ